MTMKHVTISDMQAGIYASLPNMETREESGYTQTDRQEGSAPLSQDPHFPIDRIFFYSGEGELHLSPPDLARVRSLQQENDRLQREIYLVGKEIGKSTDALALIAEKERLLLLLARNIGEVLKIHITNQERLRQISQLIEENKILQMQALTYREGYINAHHDLTLRSQHAAEYLLTQEKIERNQERIQDLTHAA